MSAIAPVPMSPARIPLVPDRKSHLLALVRPLVKDILVGSSAYRELEPDKRRQLAESMVRVCYTAASLIHEESESQQQIEETLPARRSRNAGALSQRNGGRRPLAAAQSAGTEFSGVSAAKVAGTTKAILNAVSFPRFVTDLINGVFKAMIDSSIQQMNSYVDLLNNVAASVEGFADSNFGPDRARQWLADKYPGSFEISTDSGGDNGSDGGGPTLRLKDGARMPSPEALKTDLGLGDTDSAPGGDPESSLLPLARRKLALQRQSMLASMVMLGMQRIVVESGRITASMRFHIDTRSAATEDHGSTFSSDVQTSASGSFGVGAWGVSASISAAIGYVSTQRSQSTEEMNTDLDLNSSVEINFKSDYLPLNRMASSNQVDRIRANTLNPEAEIAASTANRQLQAKEEDARRQSLSDALRPVGLPPAPTKGAGSVEDAEAARKRGNQQGQQGQNQQGQGGAAKGAGGAPSQTPRAPSGQGAGAQPQNPGASPSGGGGGAQSPPGPGAPQPMAGSPPK